MKVCKVDWCDEKARSDGYCGRHYQQFLKWGEVKRSRGDKNEIIINEKCAEIVLYDIEYNEKARALIDLEDVEKCKPYKWVFRNDGYVSTKINGKGVKLHRFIAETPKGKHTDHINRDKLDNRKLNLRVCTQSENNKNKNTYQTNKSGKRGVLLREDGKYHVAITYNRHKKHIGLFNTFEEAVRAREISEIEYYGHVLDA
jgi:Holliday junction resolvase